MADPKNSTSKTTTPIIQVGKEVVVITLPRQDLTPSKSGKTLVFCTTSGNLRTDAMLEGPDGEMHPVTLGVNAYIPNPARNDPD